MSINRQILKLALPSIVSNITVPLLGLCDTTISGHLGSRDYLAAIAVGAMCVNAIFWTLGFLRMGTTGLTAQAYGAGDRSAQATVFTRATMLALLLGVLIVVLQTPLTALLMRLMNMGASPRVEALAESYFTIVIFGAPAQLMTMAVSGWLLGMQTSVQPMLIAILTNVLNILASLLCVFGLRMGFPGTAAGTLIANWAGLGIALLLTHRFCGGRLPFSFGARTWRLSEWGRFFNVNVYIFLRSFCITGITMAVTSMGAKMGTGILAANTVLMQFFHIYSFFMDGFAFAGEALSGKAAGAHDRAGLRLTVRALLLWGGGVMLCFATVYALAGGSIASFITDDAGTLRLCSRYLFWTCVLVAGGAAAFIWDGVYIGLTATRAMLLSTATGAGAFALMVWLLPGDANDVLWGGFSAYLLLRGAVLWLRYPAEVRRVFS